MPAPQAVISIEQRSRRRIDQMIHAVDRAEYDILAVGPAVVAEATRLLELALAEEFEKGLLHPEKSTGATLKSMKSRVNGLSGEVEMAGGAPYKEFGTEAHGPKYKKYMHWEDDGNEVFARWVRGIKADDFVDRAIEDVDVEGMLGAVFGRSFLSVFTQDIED